ncbi:MAG: hypothetical protein Q9160_004649 [Pyrenula sp. 1 TL-2023]
MGIPMDNNIHAPTIPSGPTSNHRPDTSQLQRTTLTELISKKDDLEVELKALGSVLDSHGVTMTTSLTTFDGFPRSDIDVAQIRTTRARIIRLKNDYKELMKRIELGLHEHHAALGQRAATQLSEHQQQEYPQSGTIQGDTTLETPFARVNSVADGGPANLASLRVGDQIRSFGGVNWMNHENLTKVAEVVQRNEGASIRYRRSLKKHSPTLNTFKSSCGQIAMNISMSQVEEQDATKAGVPGVACLAFSYQALKATAVSEAQ